MDDSRSALPHLTGKREWLEDPANPLWRARRNLRLRLTQPGAAAQYPGLEVLKGVSSFSLGGQTVDICPAQDFSPGASSRRGGDEGTLVLTEAHLYWVGKRGKREDLKEIPLAQTESVGLSERKAVLERLLGIRNVYLELGTPSGPLRFMVGKHAGSGLVDLIQFILDNPLVEETIAIGPGAGQSVTFRVRPGDQRPSWSYDSVEARRLLGASESAREAFHSGHNRFALEQGLTPLAESEWWGIDGQWVTLDAESDM